MALWSKSQQLPTEALHQVQILYGEHFPIEVRHFMSSWIEENLWPIADGLEPSNPQYEQYTSSLITSFIQEVESKAASLNTEDLFLAKLKLMEAATSFRHKYSQNPSQLFQLIKNCLMREMKLVSEMENFGGSCTSMAADSTTNFVHQIEVLRRRTRETASALSQMLQDQETFALAYRECTKINAHLQHLATQPSLQPNVELEQKLRQQKEQQEQFLNQQLTALWQKSIDTTDQLQHTISMINSLQSKILDEELPRWKREQQLSGNGSHFNGSLDMIQERCEDLCELIWSTRLQVKEAEKLKMKMQLEPTGMTDILPTLNAQITQLLGALVTGTFIIEKQPPQVMKTNTRFASTVRLLVGRKLDLHMNPPQVEVSIINETQVNALLSTDLAKRDESSGDILNNTATMEYHQTTGQLLVNFRNMQLKRIKRSEKRGTESVVDEKFGLLFQSQFGVGGGELVFQIWTLSLPVVVIVHGNQEPHAWATVTWDNAFGELGRVSFAVPDRVPWNQMAEALDHKFCAATGRSLTETNIQYLAEKIFRSNSITGHDYSNVFLSWGQFAKEALPERTFTFWEWFYAIVKLTKEHLRGPWMDNLIMGFIKKREAEELLANCPPGTFLMRFSDSELGGITIAWVGVPRFLENTEVFMLQPFSSKDFAIRSLADRIFDLQYLSKLYPETPKELSFAKYHTPQNQTTTCNNGYVKPLLVTYVPGWGSPGAQISSRCVNGDGQSGPGNSYHSTMFQTHSPDPSVQDSSSMASDYVPVLSHSNQNVHYGEVIGSELIEDNLNLDQLN